MQVRKKHQGEDIVTYDYYVVYAMVYIFTATLIILIFILAVWFWLHCSVWHYDIMCGIFNVIYFQSAIFDVLIFKAPNSMI